MKIKATQIAEFLNRSLIGDDVQVSGINSLENATSSELTFKEKGYQTSISESTAGLIITPISTQKPRESSIIQSPTPRIDFMKAVEEFFITETNETNIHETAVVDDGATIGEACVIGPQAVVTEAVTLEPNCRVGAGAIVGIPGLHAVRDESGELLQMKHQGEVIIEEGVTIQPGAFVQQAVFDATVIKARSWIGNYCGIGHNVTVGEDTWIAPFVPVGGSVTIEPKVTIHPSASIGRHTTIGKRAVIGMNSTVLDDVPPSTTVVGTPARPVDERG